jgi:tryptophanyl-tRNA synthetase
MTPPLPRIFSGIQPTGSLHLGNYLGAIRNWVALQERAAECLFCIVDLHAITVFQEPVALRRNVRQLAAALLACGIDAERHVLFAQSAVPEHAELAWILGCHTPLGWLNRMTQFKEKAGKQKENAVLGLYSYPVLQAADILLYHATHVPVGEDQKQHLELSRDIAGAFNRAYGQEYFPLPEPLILGEATRVMSLRDGRTKMSKSDASEYSRIHLEDDAETTALKIRKAKSDPTPGIVFDPETRPEASNLLTIYAAVTGAGLKAVEEECANLQFSAFKERLAEALITHLAPIRTRYLELLREEAHLDATLERGVERAAALARNCMREVRRMVGFCG